MTDEPGSPLRIFSETEIRHFLAREVQRCTRYQDFLSVCLIRATYAGAPVPEVDRAVTSRIAEMLRSTDIVGAIGPDIAVLLVHTPDTDAGMIADRIRDRIQGDTVEVPPAGRTHVTFTVGLASFPTDATSDGGLLAHAETQLQAARRD